MNIILFDPAGVRENLLPLAFTRPIADFRVGITTIAEKWQSIVPGDYSYLTEEYLQVKYPAVVIDDNLFVAGNVIPSYTSEFILAVHRLNPGEALICGDVVVAYRGTLDDFRVSKFAKTVECPVKVKAINHIYDIFELNHDQLLADYRLIDTSDSQPLSDTCCLIGQREDAEGRPLVYIAPGAKVEGAFINTTHGPVIIDRDAEVMEGSCLRGPIYLGQHAAINMGTKVYPDTTIGPWCKVGGELNNVVFFGFSNKAHDGFLGKAVIGEWCNLGAGCVSSNLKNNYRMVRVWNYATKRFEPTSLQFCGLMMGDHSKAGINTMFNTATVVGVGCNIYGAGFPRTFIPSFSEGGAAGFADMQLSKFFETARTVMARRHRELTDADKAILEHVYQVEKG